MEITLSSAAHIRMIQLLNFYPCETRGTIKLIDRLGSLFDLTDDEKAELDYREETTTAGQGRTLFRADLTLEREVSQADADQLARVIQSPPATVPWTRSILPIYRELLAAFGHEEDA